MSIEKIINKDFTTLEHFFYSTKEEDYNFTIKYISKSNFVNKKVTKVILNNYCKMGCKFCNYSSNNGSTHISINNIERYIQGVDYIIIESGVLDKDKFLALSNILHNIDSSIKKIYFDLGIYTLYSSLDYNNSILKCFIDYVSLDKSLNKELGIKNTWDEVNGILLNKRFNIYSNFIVDLPGQDFEIIIKDLLFLTNKSDILGIKVLPFIAKKNTKFEIFDDGCVLNVLKVLILARIYRPDWEIFLDIHNMNPKFNKLKNYNNIYKFYNIDI